MKDFAIVGGKLALICAAAALILGMVNAVTAPAIKLRKQQEFQAAVSSITGKAKIGEQKTVSGNPVVKFYLPVFGAEDTVTGYVMELTGAGYGGDVKMLAGFGTDGTVSAVVMMDNQETPGLREKSRKSGVHEEIHRQRCR